jgi:hypothetical protein
VEAREKSLSGERLRGIMHDLITPYPFDFGKDNFVLVLNTSTISLSLEPINDQIVCFFFVNNILADRVVKECSLSACELVVVTPTLHQGWVEP